MEDVEVCTSWEEIEENSNIVERQLEKLKLEKAKQGSQSHVEDGPKIRILSRKSDPDKGDTPQPQQIQLDSTREESLRSQYVPPEPKISILSRPKTTSARNSNGQKSKAQPVKTLEQREKEYMEARKRILGDIQFEDPEDEVSSSDVDGSNLSPAEILKQKIAQAMKQEDDGDVADAGSDEGKVSSGEGEETAAGPSKKSKSRGKKRREKIKTLNPETPRDFPLSKTESERIVRQPRGPDGTTGFQLQR